MTCRLLLISGSLRRASMNTAVLRTVTTLVSEGTEAVLYEGLADLPHFNPDDEGAVLDPRVAALRRAIHEADALMFCTPEYAGALPGSFKNLLDWCIGDDHPGSIYEKPAAWINASPRGARGAHAELRTVLSYASAVIIDPACVDIPLTSAMVGTDGLVTDKSSRRKIATAVGALVEEACSPTRSTTLPGPAGGV